MVENKITGWVEFAAFAIVVYVVYTLISSFQLFGTPMPLMSVVSGSMEPVLYAGDMLIITGGSYNKNDIIIYYNDNWDKVVVHRIIEVTDNGFMIKGDNNNNADGIFPKEQILGKIRVAIPLLGYPKLWLYKIEKIVFG